MIGALRVKLDIQIEDLNSLPPGKFPTFLSSAVFFFCFFLEKIFQEYDQC